MSTIPQSLKDLKQMIRSATNDTWIMSIRAPASDIPYRGYHAGYKDIYGPNGVGGTAYSVIRPRDKRDHNLNHVPPLASENGSSAIDVTVRGLGNQNARIQQEFTAWIVKQAKAGLMDIMFVGGPDANGNPKVWEKPYWKPHDGPDKYHTHISFPRDTEFVDRTTQFKAYFDL